MKAMKKMLAMLLAVCMLIGMPLCMDVAATGDPESDPLKLVQATMIPEHWDTELDRNTQVVLHFSGHVHTVTAKRIKAFIGIVGKNNWMYDNKIRHYAASWLDGEDVFDRISFEGTLDLSGDAALYGETTKYNNRADTNRWVFTMNPKSTDNMDKEANIAPQYQKYVDGEKVDTIPELFALAKAVDGRLAVVLVDLDATGDTFSNALGRTKNDGSGVNLMGDTKTANTSNGNDGKTDGSGRTGAHAVVYDETTAARMTGATLDSVTKTLTVNFSDAMTVRKGLLSGLMVLNSQGQLMAQTDGEFAVHPTAGYGVMLNTSAYPLTITSGTASGSIALDAAAYNRIINWQNLVNTHNDKHPEDPLRVLFYVGEEWDDAEALYWGRGEAQANYYLDSLYTDDLRPFMADYKKNAAAGLSDYMVTEITVRNYAVSANGKGYDTLTEALNAAVSGDTVTLLADCAAEEIQIQDGVTLDLNGKTLTATSVVANVGGKGIVKDSSDGKGGIAIAQDAMALHVNNSQLPLYDNGTYRFFNCETTQLFAGDDAKAMFGVQFTMNDAAYTLLAQEGNAGMVLTGNLALTLDDKTTNFIYDFKAANVTSYAANKLADDGKNWAIVLTVTGFDKLEGEFTFASTPTLTAAGVTVTLPVATYEKGE